MKTEIIHQISLHLDEAEATAIITGKTLTFPADGEQPERRVFVEKCKPWGGHRWRYRVVLTMGTRSWVGYPEISIERVANCFRYSCGYFLTQAPDTSAEPEKQAAAA
jgi:hypothetical protein